MAETTSNEPIEAGRKKWTIREHEKTYGLFLGLTKYVTLGVVALLVSMAFGFLHGRGLHFRDGAVYPDLRRGRIPPAIALSDRKPGGECPASGE